MTQFSTEKTVDAVRTVKVIRLIADYLAGHGHAVPLSVIENLARLLKEHRLLEADNEQI